MGTEESEHPACEGTIIPATKAKRVAIPELEVDASFAANWRTTSIAGCSTIVDGAKNGFVLAGTADATDAALSILASSDHEVFVEVQDDVVIAPRAGAIADELLIWTSPHFSGMGMQCDATTPTTRFRVTVADGKLSHVSGPMSAAPSVELGAGSPRRFRVVFPEELSSWAIGYRDTDDGVTFERTLATSKIRTAVATELGRTFRVRPEDARCVSVGNRLVLDRPSPNPLHAIAEGY
jgi:hypothetical protein